MIPFGIITQNRVQYLDITLKSLSAADLPGNTALTIFDDCSDADTQAYYKTNQAFPNGNKWPKWHSSLGIDQVINTAGVPVGIADKVLVRQLANKPIGVVRGSCQAVCRLFEQNTNAPGVVLLQDDVIFKPDFYQRLMEVVNDPSLYGDKQLGLLAGLKLNHVLKFKGDKPKVVPSGITAQCLYISKAAYEKLDDYFHANHTSRSRFDDSLRRTVAKRGLWAGTIYPYCCQHIGFESRVRPDRRWSWHKKGRVGYYVHPPYSIGPEIRSFPNVE